MPATRVGVLGGGQLGLMLGLEGAPLGLELRFFDPSPEAPAARAGSLCVGEFTDLGALERFAQGCEVITYEFESVPVQAARACAAHAPVWPPPEALEVAQDRLLEKQLFDRLGIPVAPYEPVSSDAELERAVARLGLPLVLKTRRLGYDGKGQRVLRHAHELAGALEALGRVPCIAERLVSFEHECSVLAARSRSGEVATYPLVDNRHEGGILRRSTPLDEDHPLTDPARRHVTQVLTELDYVGVLALELFVTEAGLLANELAPRVHNSGHWTLGGAVTSQFENHLRAVLALPLGETTPLAHVAMLNLIGSMPPREAVLAVPGARYFSYGKRPATGRKLGHVNVLAPSREALGERVARLERLL